MLQLSPIEADFLWFQFGTSKKGRGGRRYNPFAFTENGVAMLSSILKSERAIHVNIAIMRIFTKLRNFQLIEKPLDARMAKLEKGTNQLFRIVFEKLDSIEEIIIPKLPPNRRKIGFEKKGT